MREPVNTYEQPHRRFGFTPIEIASSQAARQGRNVFQVMGGTPQPFSSLNYLTSFSGSFSQDQLSLKHE
jgi:hypothetical protein